MAIPLSPEPPSKQQANIAVLADMRYVVIPIMLFQQGFCYTSFDQEPL